jgi:serine protease Do
MLRLFTSAIILAGLLPLSHAGAATQPVVQAKSAASTYYASTPNRSYLGVDIRDITQDRVAALKLKEERGVEVTMVDQDAPAGKAGIKEHDVILDFNGTGVESEEQLRRMIRETPVGRTVTLGISRDGSPMKLSVQLAEHNKVLTGRRIEIPPIPPVPDMDFSNRIDVPNVMVMRNLSPTLGVQTENLGQQLGDFFGVKNGDGVLVRSVEKGSPAEKAGVKAGDVIVRVGDEKLSDRVDLSRIMRKHREGGKLSLGIVRDKHEQTVTVDLPQRRSKDSSELVIDDDAQDLDASLRDLDEISVDLDADMEAWSDEFGEIGNTLHLLGPTMEMLNCNLKGVLTFSDSMI